MAEANGRDGAHPGEAMTDQPERPQTEPQLGTCEHCWGYLPHAKNESCVNWQPIPEPSAGASREEVNLHATMDARVWAQEFMRLVGNNKGCPPDEETMVGWFANAIMVGYDFSSRHAASRSISPAPNRNDYVAWLRWTGEGYHHHLVLCDSDSPGAFKVYRGGSPASPAPAPPDIEFDVLKSGRCDNCNRNVVHRHKRNVRSGGCEDTLLICRHCDAGYTCDYCGEESALAYYEQRFGGCADDLATEAMITAVFAIEFAEHFLLASRSSCPAPTPVPHHVITELLEELWGVHNGNCICICELPPDEWCKLAKTLMEWDSWAAEWKAGSPASPAPAPDDDVLISERDAAEDMCDELADAISRYMKVDIGEHSNLNNPWHNALDALASAPEEGADAHPSK